MTEPIKDIYLSWRKGKGSRRYLVGRLRKDLNKVYFTYLENGVKYAETEGFQGYTDFPDYKKNYSEGVLDIFSQRLTPFDRSGSKSAYKFWQVPEQEVFDSWMMLAYTQGLLPTDNFELLAEFNPIKGLSFITDLAGLSHLELDAKLINIGEELQWVIEEDNPFNSKAVMVTKDGKKIGYVKQVHSNIFNEYKSGPILIKVHAIEKNGFLKRVFIKVYLA